MLRQHAMSYLDNQPELLSKSIDTLHALLLRAPDKTSRDKIKSIMRSKHQQLEDIIIKEDSYVTHKRTRKRRSK